jgi:hypothetical protein
MFRITFNVKLPPLVLDLLLAFKLFILLALHKSCAMSFQSILCSASPAQHTTCFPT